MMGTPARALSLVTFQRRGARDGDPCVSQLKRECSPEKPVGSEDVQRGRGRHKAEMRLGRSRNSAGPHGEFWASKCTQRVIGHGPLPWGLAIHSRPYVSGQHSSQPPRAIPTKRTQARAVSRQCLPLGNGCLGPLQESGRDTNSTKQICLTPERWGRYFDTHCPVSDL